MKAGNFHNMNFLFLQPFLDLQYVFLEKKETAPSVEKPKILEVKRKRIKKRKGNKSLLKKCLGLDKTPRKFKNKGRKKKDLSSSQSRENAEKPEMEPSQPKPFENHDAKKENLVLSPIPLCANVKKEDLVSNKESPCGDKVENLSDNHVVEPSLSAKPYHSAEKDSSGSLLDTPLGNQDGGSVSENEAPVIGKSNVNVKKFSQLELGEALMNGMDNSSIGIPDPTRLWPTVDTGSGDEMVVTSAVDDLKHAHSEESYYAREMDTSVSNFTNDMCMNHISTDLESSTIPHGLGMLLESL